MAVKIRAFQKNAQGKEIEFAVAVNSVTGVLFVGCVGDLASTLIESRELAEILIFHKLQRMRVSVRNHWIRGLFKDSGHPTFKRLWSRLKKNTRFEIEEV